MMLPQPVKAAYRSARTLYRRLRKRSVFEKIYREPVGRCRVALWNRAFGLAATEKVRKGLVDAIQQLDVHTIIDAPCGDFYWLSTLDLAQHLTWYRGFDIVPQAIAKNKQRFTTEKIS